MGRMTPGRGPGASEERLDASKRRPPGQNAATPSRRTGHGASTRRLADQLLALCGLALDRKAAAFAKPDRLKLVAAVKHARLPLRGTLGFEKAEVTAGGVSLDEVDSRTMQSKRQPGLYFAGEVLDLDGWIGGYNFQSAWSTGWLAGREL